MNAGLFQSYQMRKGGRPGRGGGAIAPGPETFGLIYINALFCGVALQLALFLRNTPYGIPYVLDLSNYLPHALFYSCYGISLVSVPMLFVAAIGRQRVRLWVFWVYVMVLAVTLIVTQIDNEILRFLGMHLSIDYIFTYTTVSGIPLSIHHAIRDDVGGSYGAVFLFLVPLIFFVLSTVIIRRVNIKIPRRIVVVATVVVGLVFVVVPFFLRTSLFGSKNRQYKVAPVVIVLAESLRDACAPKTDFTDIAERSRRVGGLWSAVNTQKGWHFTSESDPLAKRMEGLCPSFGKTPWNFVIISIETFRAMNMPLLNPNEEVETTPFIRSLATSEHSSYYTRFISNGQPTIFSFMALHTGLLPHSRKTVARSFTRTKLDSYASLLRQHGYHAAFFSGSDPDWDNQRRWLSQWYDFVYYDKADKEEDRQIMRSAAKYLKEKAQRGAPFVLTAFLISNHMPFDSPEPGFYLYQGTDLRRKITNTMRYDDDVIREFFESVKNEPWYANTVFIITGDHGIDLGERGKVTGWENTRHETNWVPLVIHAQHPLMKQGRIDVPASHIDLAPTLLHMAGICQDNRFMGHSLFASSTQRRAINIKNGNFGMEVDNFSIFIPKRGEPLLYRSEDILQKEDVSSHFPDIVKGLIRMAQDYSKIADYAYECVVPLRSTNLRYGVVSIDRSFDKTSISDNPLRIVPLSQLEKHCRRKP